MMSLVNGYIDQWQLVEAMNSEGYPNEPEVEHLVELGNELGELIALDTHEKELRDSEVELF